MTTKLPLIVIVGPTATGKTDLGIALAKRLDGEIVSGDSMQIYRHMNIGTAKPTAEERSRAVHHMVDMVEPSEVYSVARFVAEAKRCIADIHSRGKIPIVVGGTGLYISWLVDNINLPKPTEADNTRRDRLHSYYMEHGAEALHDMLKQVDSVSAEEIHPNNVVRVIRAIEHFELTGIPLSRQKVAAREIPSPYTSVLFGLNYDSREVLYDRINYRVDLMMEQGLLCEVKHLYSLETGLTAKQAIGYKEFLPYFSGECSLEQSVDKVKQHSRNYAKRQLTWFRKDERIHWLDAADKEAAAQTAVSIATRELEL